MICIKCGQNIADDAEFCGFCGERISSDSFDKNADNKKCPQCGSFIESDSLFCGECGYRFSKIENNDFSSDENTFITNEQPQESTIISDNSKQMPKNKEKAQKNNILIYVLLSIVAILLCCCIYMFLNSNSSDVNNNSNTNINTEIDNSENNALADNESKEIENTEDAEANESTDDLEENGDCLLPTDKKYITFDDLEEFSKDEVALIRNEIYARHGYVFQSEPFKSYFSEKEWYIPNPDFTDAEFSEIELTNKDLIVEYETEKGWR